MFLEYSSYLRKREPSKKEEEQQRRLLEQLEKGEGMQGLGAEGGGELII
jgi:hypothetical protein